MRLRDLFVPAIFTFPFLAAVSLFDKRVPFRLWDLSDIFIHVMSFHFSQSMNGSAKTLSLNLRKELKCSWIISMRRYNV